MASSRRARRRRSTTREQSLKVRSLLPLHCVLLKISIFSLLDNIIREYAVKVYKTTKVEFRDREKYITGEWRFRRQLDLGTNLSVFQGLNTHNLTSVYLGNKNKTIKLWAEKEVRNLKRLKAASIPCPTPIFLKVCFVELALIKDGLFLS